MTLGDIYLVVLSIELVFYITEVAELPKNRGKIKMWVRTEPLKNTNIYEMGRFREVYKSDRGKK